MQSFLTNLIELLKKDPRKTAVYAGCVIFLCFLPVSFSYLAIIAGAVLIAVFQFKAQDFYFKKSPARNLGYAFLAALFLFLFAQVWLILKSEMIFIIPKVDSLTNILIYSLLLAVVEEMLYRGFMMRLNPGFKHESIWIVIIALIMMLHTRSLSGLCVGIVLATLAIKSDSIYPAIFTSFVVRILITYEYHHIEQFSWLLKYLSARSLIQQIGLILLGFGLFALAMSFACKCIKTSKKADEQLSQVKIQRIQIPKTPLWRHANQTKARQAYAIKRIKNRKFRKE